MANGNPSFNNPAVFVGTMDEPTKKVGSTAMAREEKTMKKMPKKMTLSEFNTMVRGMVKEALVKELAEAKRVGGYTPDTGSYTSNFHTKRFAKKKSTEQDKKSKKDMDAAKKKSKLQELGTQPPPVPARAMIQPPQKVGGPPPGAPVQQPPQAGKSVPPPVPAAPNAKPQPVDINAVMAKRQSGQPLNPEEKRAYLDHVAGQNKTAQGQAQQQAAQSPVGQAMTAVEKNPNQFVK